MGSKTAAKDSCASGGHGDICVGIVGLGNLGKQLLFNLLQKTRIKPTQTKISTRNPESADSAYFSIYQQRNAFCFRDFYVSIAECLGHNDTSDL
ncbi:hypothetical protein CHARACLAT_001517 [Characodon lateralis]|uniref:Pyrroline-5-carboxylate reductase catalytic N-terminal domain-containing protein n=1 Tax=Characodon lateralis TaxID=208331 RepID=A0ABU7CK40_9TELE|nr:hypothetical protein [Characodon lateralis]